MNGNYVNKRPKIIYFPSSLSGLNIAAKQSLLWPCHAFNISIPQKKQNSLNIFEETILRLTEIESSSTEKLADITCMNQSDDGNRSIELVSFIQSRLNYLRLVDDRFEITEDGKELLKNLDNDSLENSDYVSGTVFLDLHSGKLLPYIHIGNVIREKIVSIDNNHVKVRFGSTGKSKKRNCRLIRPTRNSYWDKVPESKDIVKIIREYKRKYKQFVLLNKNLEQYPPNVPSAKAISLQDDPELIYLYCELIIQKGYTDLLVTNGCGLGFSTSFAEYLTTKNFQWITALKRKGIIQELDSIESNVKTQQKIWRYEEITKRFNYDSADGKVKGINTLLNSLNNLPTTTAEEVDYIAKRQDIAIKLYSALEWSLRYTLIKYGVPEWEQIFLNQNYRANKRLLNNFAEKIGFTVTPQNVQLLQLKAGAVKMIEKGKVQLQPLLALLIIGAATKYKNHPFHRLAVDNIYFLSDVLRLKKLRDPIAHGSISDFKVDQSLLTEIVQKFKNTILLLLPLISEELNNFSQNDKKKSIDINQERLKAEVYLENSLGTAFFMNLSTEIKELMIRSELINDESIEMINCYCSTIQQILWDVNANRRRSSFEENNLREGICNRMIELGFYKSTNDIPVEFSSVNPIQIRRAIKGTNSTLGGVLLSVFYLASIEELSSLKTSEPGIVDFIAYLLQLRGHGNQMMYDISKQQFAEIKNRVFKIIKVITEVF